MLRGRFGADGRPYVNGLLIVPRLRSRANVTFLVDTGADTTMLSPSDGRVMGIDYRRLGNRDMSVGIGGSIQTYHEPAAVIFFDGQAPRSYRIHLSILPNR